MLHTKKIKKRSNSLEVITLENEAIWLVESFKAVLPKICPNKSFPRHMDGVPYIHFNLFSAEKTLKKSSFGPFLALFTQIWTNGSFAEKLDCHFSCILYH